MPRMVMNLTILVFPFAMGGVTSDKLHHEEPAAEIGVLDDRVKAFADEARDLLVRGEVAAEEGLQRVDDDQVGVSIGRFGKLPVQ